MLLLISAAIMRESRGSRPVNLSSAQSDYIILPLGYFYRGFMLTFVGLLTVWNQKRVKGKAFLSKHSSPEIVVPLLNSNFYLFAELYNPFEAVGSRGFALSLSLVFGSILVGLACGCSRLYGHFVSGKGDPPTATETTTHF
ncbi:uncharacterized protein [Malus domestica]|uniref:uncharacterized protein isoform X1 n=1 Tax=Malus domestica TaxID=3750 RepID=UPI003976A349